MIFIGLYSWNRLHLSCRFADILYIFANAKNENERFFRILLSIKEASRINEISILIGIILLVIGNFLGGIWANESWGRYWGWDPKETWAFLTWIGYILYIHYRFYHPREDKKAMYLLASAFVILLICWFGVNYLPTAQNSVHTYTS